MGLGDHRIVAVGQEIGNDQDRVAGVIVMMEPFFVSLMSTLTRVTRHFNILSICR